MTRAAVTFLIAVQLLVPPGMCVCDFAPRGRAAAGTPHERVTSPGSAPAACRCDSCRAGEADAGAPNGGHDRTAAPADDLPAGPSGHAPGCPAELGDMPAKMVVSIAPPPLDAPAAAGYATRVAEPAVSVGCRPPSPGGSVVSPPLFISHCALLI